MSDSNLEISIGGRRVGPGCPVYFIAEAGSNHDGRLDQAKRLIDVAVDAGADAVKFQAFKAATLYPKRAGQSEYLKDPRSIYDIIHSLEMPLDWIAPLAAYCEQRGVHFLCTPFDDHSADALAPYVPAFKLASYDMTNTPLLQYVARRGKPLIVSTGTAELGEVREMVAAIRAVGDSGLVVLQCTAKYPAPLAALNVRTVATMAELGVLTGFSDHSREPLPGPMAAVALGAVVIEKHFTYDKTLPGNDHYHAMDPDDIRASVRHRDYIASLIGEQIEKTVSVSEEKARAYARRSLVAACDIKAGTKLTPEMIVPKRPGTGLSPLHYDKILGSSIRVDVKKDDLLQWEMFMER
jgi:N,N'-diacetyllegionaminate synthase